MRGRNAKRSYRICAGALAVMTACGVMAGNPWIKKAEAAVNQDHAEALPILRDVVGEELCPIFGAGITEGEMNDPKLWELVTTHFSAVTFGNELKPDALFGYSNGRCPGTKEEELDGETITVPVMDFSRAERMLNKVKAWNEEHPDRTIMVRGHVLVWHSQTPEWFFHEDYDKTKPYVDKETMDKRQKWYIKTVLTHFTGEDSPYAGMFYGWDVVNEAVSGNTYRTDAEDPNEDLSQDTHGSNSSWWHVYQSSEYIINAFRYANQYAPATVELYYNDYGECSDIKRVGIKELLKAVKAEEGAPGEGTRIDAMGMQGHYSLSDPAFDAFSLAIETYCEVVGKVQITEFDLQSSDGYDGTDATREDEYARHASRYRLLYSMLKKAADKPGVTVGGITFWGVVDKYSWLQGRSTVGGGSTKIKPQCPLLFDDNYEPKPSFWVFADASRLTSEGKLKEPETEAGQTEETKTGTSREEVSGQEEEISGSAAEPASVQVGGTSQAGEPESGQPEAGITDSDAGSDIANIAVLVVVFLCVGGAVLFVLKRRRG